ncbi:hypothetical protein [Streptomyces rochei]|uniref:hypothetical protein n=1 Tax=Streptomyces rochei TaxID=1928 RepID=UPI0033A8E365
MTEQGFDLGSDGWQRLIAARDVYTRTVSVHYDEVLYQLAQRAQTDGCLGKADIGALVLSEHWCCGSVCAPTPAGPAP